MQAHTASQRQTRLQQKGKRINGTKAKQPLATTSTGPDKVVSADLAALRQKGQDLLAMLSRSDGSCSMTQKMHGSTGNVDVGLGNYSPLSALYVEPCAPSVLNSYPTQKGKEHKQPRVIEPPSKCSAALAALRQQGQDTLASVFPSMVSSSIKAPRDMKSDKGAQTCMQPETLSSDLWMEEPDMWSTQQFGLHSVLFAMATRPPPGLEAPMIPDVGTKLPPGLEPPPGLQLGFEFSTTPARSVEPSRPAPTLLQSRFGKNASTHLKQKPNQTVACEQEPLKVDLDCLNSLSVVS